MLQTASRRLKSTKWSDTALQNVTYRVTKIRMVKDKKGEFNAGGGEGINGGVLLQVSGNGRSTEEREGL